MNEAQLEMRPLGLLAVGAATLSVALAVSYFFIPLAPVVAVVALLLGGVSRTDPVTRGLGNLAILLAVIAIALSITLMIKWL